MNFKAYTRSENVPQPFKLDSKLLKELTIFPKNIDMKSFTNALYRVKRCFRAFYAFSFAFATRKFFYPFDPFYEKTR